MTTLAEYEGMLDEAKKALHKFSIGARIVEVSSPTGQSVKYGVADINDLRKYIAYLTEMIESLGGTVQRMPNRRALRFGF